MDKYIVITPHGCDVFSGSLRECNAYLKQAHKKGSEPGYLAIAPFDLHKKCDHAVVLDSDGTFRIFTCSDFRRLGKKYWLCLSFSFISSTASDVNEHMRLWLKYDFPHVVPISFSTKSLVWPGLRAYAAEKLGSDYYLHV